MSQPSRLVLDHLPELHDAARLGPVVDLACGQGRHALALAREGIDCVGLDRSRDSLRALRAAAAGLSGSVEPVACDLEKTAKLPIREGTCGAILVFRFLFRPLSQAIERALAPGGLLLYETFTRDQPEHGWGPRRADFLLESGELPQLFRGLEILHHDELPIAVPRPEASARLMARRRPA